MATLDVGRLGLQSLPITTIIPSPVDALDAALILLNMHLAADGIGRNGIGVKSGIILEIPGLGPSQHILCNIKNEVR